MKAFKQTYCAAACAALILTACGGSNNDNIAPGSGETPSATLSGTAAAGAALVGTVTVKDATGKTRTVAIGAGGGYSVDVSDMTGPFVLRASGSVGGRTYTIHSATVDATRTINVTPLTDLIVANIAGQIAQNFFDNPDARKLTPAALEQQQAALRQRLETVLAALGVDAAVDLLHTQFTADHTRLDAALDVLRVSVDPATHVATITNVITREKIEDNLASQTDDTRLTDTTNLQDGVSDLQAIVVAMTSFSDRFANGLPQESELLPLLHPDFLHQDQAKAEFVAEASGDPDNQGLQFTNVELQSLSGDTAVVSFDVLGKEGALDTHDRDFQLKKTDGKWLLMGNQSALEVENFAMSFQTSQGSSGISRTTGLEFWIEDLNPNNSPNVSYAMVTGPGLPEGGVRFSKPSLGGAWHTSGSSSFYPIATDEAILSIRDNASYRITIHNSDESVFAAYDKMLPKRPYSHEEMTALAFPVFSAETLARLTAYQGGAFDGIMGTLPQTARAVWLGLWGGDAFTEGSFAAANGAFGPHSLSVTSVQEGINPMLRASYIDGFYREVFTVHYADR